MKTLVTLAASALFVLNAQAVSFDIGRFGESLNGWGKKRAATYTFVDGTYRTHYPTVTKLSSGGLFVTTQIDQGAGSGNVLHLELTFAADGRLMIGQVKGTVAGFKVDSGLVTRAPQALPTADSEVVAPADPLSPTDRLAADLFSAFDAALLKNMEGKEEKADLMSRLFGNKNKANISGAVRHNFNLIIRSIH